MTRREFVLRKEGVEVEPQEVRWPDYATPAMSFASTKHRDIRLCRRCRGSGNLTFLRSGRVAFRRCTTCAGRGMRWRLAPGVTITEEPAKEQGGRDD